MARGAQIELRLVRHLREREHQIRRQPRRRRAHVRARDRVDRGLDARERVGEERGEPGVDGDLFALDLCLEHLEAVAHRDDGARLDEEGRPARARRVHDPGEALVRVAPDGDDPAPLALGDEVVLEDAGVFAHQLFEAVDHPLARRLVLAPQLAQTRARAVGERAVGLEAAGDLLGESVERRVGRARLVQAGGAGAVRLEKAAQSSRFAEDLRQRLQLRGAEHPADAEPAHRLADVGQRFDREWLTGGEERARLLRLPQQRPRFRARARKGEGERGLPPHRGERSVGERGQDAVPLEVVAGLGGRGVFAERFGHGKSANGRVGIPATACKREW